MVLRGDIPSERSRLDQVKNKILDRVKQKKTVRQQSRERRNSISSVGSTASKRGSVDRAGGDQSRVKVDKALPVLPLPRVSNGRIFGSFISRFFKHPWTDWLNQFKTRSH